MYQFLSCQSVTLYRPISIYNVIYFFHIPAGLCYRIMQFRQMRTVILNSFDRSDHKRVNSLYVVFKILIHLYSVSVGILFQNIHI